MATQVQRRKGTTVQHSTFTGASAELTVDTTKNTVVVHNGSTAGGFPLAKDSEVVHLTGAETVAGVKTLSSNPILSAGTANGVTYLNGSKVLTSGSALTFDGGNLGVGTSSPVNASNQKSITIDATTTSRIDLRSGGVARFNLQGNATETSIVNDGLTPFVYYINGAEQMRLTSTGLGIGTSSPSRKLSVVGSGVFTDGTNDLTVYNDGSVGTNGNINLKLITNGTVKATLDTSGNLGLGVTPSAWGVSRALQINGSTSLWNFGTNNTYVGNNYYYDGGNRRYYANGFATEYHQSANGTHAWLTAPSGTAGAAISFTQAMTLDAAGNLTLGATSGTSRLEVRAVGVMGRFSTLGANDGRVEWGFNGTDIGYIGADSSTEFSVLARSGNVLKLGAGGSEKARIDSSGNLLVGTTSNLLGTARKMSVEGTVAAVFKNAGGGNEVVNIFNPSTTGDNPFIEFGTEAGYIARGSITYNRAGGLTAYNTTSDYRAKDIIGLVTDSGALIDSVPVYMGKMKGATQERPMFIAHEVPTYAHTGEKDAVDAEGNPVYQQMDASALVPVMWAEIKSLRQRLAALEAA